MMTASRPALRGIARLGAHGTVGALAGFLLLHPLSVHINHSFEGHALDLVFVLEESFSPVHFHMGLYFAAIGAVFGLAYGVYSSRLARLNEEVTRLSLTDALTSLSNRRHLAQRLDEEVDRCLRYGRSLALIMADIDHFKGYNDAFGHRAGDELLRRVAGVLLEHVRRPDFVARYGGEEFAVVMPETDRSRALILAERIRRDVKALATPTGGAGILREVTLSLGVAELPADAADAGSLIEEADRALYHAKRSGRDRVFSSREAADQPGSTGAGDAGLSGEG